MPQPKVLVLVRREYRSRIRTKAFWIGTLALPLLMVGLAVLPAMILARTRATERLVVVDASGRVGPLLVAELARAGEGGDTGVRFEVELGEPAADADAQRAALDRRVLGGEIDAWLWIDRASLEGERVQYHGENVSNLLTQNLLAGALSAVVRRVRLADAGLDEGLVDELSRPVGLATFRVTAGGARAEAGFAGVILGYAFGMLLYLAFLLYGTQVLNGVLEEKASRVVEVMLASVRPRQLMLGKLVGICLVGLTQLAIWIGTLVALTAPGVVAALDWLPAESLPRVPLAVIVHFFLFFLLGYFLVATLYGAIGAAFNSAQEAQQLAGVATMLVVVPFLLMFAVINAPDSTLAVVASLIPPFTPMLMTVRIAVSSPPLWQVLAGYLLTAAFGLAMVSLAARVYRVGILMYGKKPRLAELWRWLRYA